MHCRMITYVDWINVAFVKRSHVPVREQPIWEQRQKNKLRQGQQLIARKCKPRPSVEFEN